MSRGLAASPCLFQRSPPLRKTESVLDTKEHNVACNCYYNLLVAGLHREIDTVVRYCSCSHDRFVVDLMYIRSPGGTRAHHVSHTRSLPPPRKFVWRLLTHTLLNRFLQNSIKRYLLQGPVTKKRSIVYSRF